MLESRLRPGIYKAKRVFVITGTSRGLGLEMVRQLATIEGNLIFATARNLDAAPDLEALARSNNGRVEIVTLDTSDKNSIRDAVEAIKKKTFHVDVLINNAAVVEGPNFKDGQDLAANSQDLVTLFETNVAGVQSVIQEFLPLLKAAVKNDGKEKKSCDIPKVINISSIKGSITKELETTGKDRDSKFAYSVSKAALNMLTACWAAETPDIAFIPLHPGWVDTDGGRVAGDKPPVQPEESIKGILSVIDDVRLSDSGKKLLVYDGTTLPW